MKGYHNCNAEKCIENRDTRMDREKFPPPILNINNNTCFAPLNNFLEERVHLVRSCE